MKKLIILSLAVLTLPACGIYKKYEPTQEVPENLYGAVEADSLNLGNLQWEELFSDPDLQGLIRRGLENNTDYLTAQLRVKQAEATLMSSKLAFLPSFALSPQGSINSFDGGSAMKTYTVPVSASWQVDLFGSLLNAKRQSQSAVAQSEAYQQAVRSQVIASIANCYYTLLMLDTQYAISTETKGKWEESVRVARAMKEAGMYTQAGVSQTEATYYSICSSLEDLQEQINQAQNTLCQLLGTTPQPIQRGELKDQRFPEQFGTGVPLEMLSNRPDVKRAEQGIANAFYGVAQARSAFYPALNLSGTAGWTNNAGMMIVNPGKAILTAVGTLTQPLFNNGKNVARLKIAKAQQEEATLAFHQTLLNAGTEVNNALTRYQTAMRKATILDLQIEALQTAVKSTDLLMQHGNTNYLEVLTAQQTLLNAQLTQTANRLAEIQGMINLYQALGGGR